MNIALKAHIETNHPQLKGKKLLLAVSGGIDSVVLTDLFYKLGFEIGLAHCNFQLRGKESSKDELFVNELGARLKCPVYSKRFDTEEYAAAHRLSVQMAARELRYRWFEKIRRKKNYDYILTAHHKEDVLETFLINFIRGTGLSGLTGIPNASGSIVRPLLPFTRNDILIHATKHKLNWREDESNASVKYVRNKIRHKIVPVMKEINPNLLGSFDTTLENLAGADKVVQSTVNQLREVLFTSKEEELHIAIKPLRALDNPKFYVYELLKDYGFTEWNDVVNLLDAQSGKQLFSTTFRLLKDRKNLILSPIQPEMDRVTYAVSETTKHLGYPIPLRFEKMVLPNSDRDQKKRNPKSFVTEAKDSIHVDYDRLRFPLTVRKWEKGDFFHPQGMTGQKKVSKYFKDEKLSLVDKEKTWLLCSEGAIVWIIGHRMDDRFKVTEATKTVFHIAIDKSVH
jgi:tRNA(Ile)-lysidine synthase